MSKKDSYTAEERAVFERLYVATLTGAVQSHYQARVRLNSDMNRYMENNIAAVLAEDAFTIARWAFQHYQHPGNYHQLVPPKDLDELADADYGFVHENPEKV